MYRSSWKPAVSKYWLFALAGLMWSGVGVMLCRLAYGWLAEFSRIRAGSFGLVGIALAMAAYRFVFAGIVTVLGGITMTFASRRRPQTRSRGFVFKRRYGTYYALNFLQGCRKQMFITFAIFALVKVHGMPVATTMVLVLINQSLITVTAPMMGRLVDRYGERWMLSLSYIGLSFVFFGYAVVHHRPTLYALYCIDNLIFFGGIALTTYLHKIAPEEDLRPTLSMGVTMNHVAAVIAPFVGGIVWYYLGYQIIFYSGSVLALISLGVSQWVNPDKILREDGERAGVLEPAVAPAAPTSS